jgi:hypothetical protein
MATLSEATIIPGLSVRILLERWIYVSACPIFVLFYVTESFEMGISP